MKNDKMILGNCTCCGYPYELINPKEEIIVVGCNKQMKKMNIQCVLYGYQCHELKDCPLHDEMSIKKTKDDALLVFNYLKKEFKKTGNVYLFLDDTNHSLRDVMGKLLSSNGWEFNRVGYKNGFNKFHCFPL